jgi:hypothetical protein
MRPTLDILGLVSHFKAACKHQNLIKIFSIDKLRKFGVFIANWTKL